MFKKHGILAVTMFLSLILANGVGAGTELEDIVNTTQTATWAYYTDEIDLAKISSSSRWYISPLVSGVPNINDVFSLGIGAGGWWTVGKGVGTIDMAMTQIKVAPNLDTDPSNTFFDVGRQISVTDPRIHDDRQRVQGKTHPIVWYFFLVPNRTWYIVNASRTGPSWDVYRLGWAADGGYDWSRIDISGYSVIHTPHPSGHTLILTFNRESFRLSVFPLPNKTHLSVSINSVFDHSMTTTYCPDNRVVAYTGEEGKSTFDGELVGNITNCGDLFGFKKDTVGTAFSLKGQYVGGGTPQFLYYDGHPGYDYRTVDQCPGGPVTIDCPTGLRGQLRVRAAADGIVKALNLDYGRIELAHGSEYETWYMHLSQMDASIGQTGSAGQYIGVAGEKKAPGNPHLHFEVRKNGIPVDPYGWEGTGNDPYLRDVNRTLW